MVAKLDGPQFSGGANIAIKCPAHTYDQTVAFYRDTLALPLIEEESDGCIFQFGPNRLWIDKVPNLSHPDIWLEIETNDTEAASSFLRFTAARVAMKWKICAKISTASSSSIPAA